MARKISPERRERIRRTNDEGRRARAQMQEIIERIEARKVARETREVRRRQLLRRIFLLGRAA